MDEVSKVVFCSRSRSSEAGHLRSGPTWGRAEPRSGTFLKTFSASAGSTPEGGAPSVIIYTSLKSHFPFKLHQFFILFRYISQIYCTLSRFWVCWEEVRGLSQCLIVEMKFSCSYKINTVSRHPALPGQGFSLRWDPGGECRTGRSMESNKAENSLVANRSVF